MVLKRLSLPNPMLGVARTEADAANGGLGWLPHTPSLPQLCRSVGLARLAVARPAAAGVRPPDRIVHRRRAVIRNDHRMMAERILARVDALVTKRVAGRAAELGRHLVGEVVVGDEAHLALGVRRQDLARRAQLHADAGRRRIERLGVERLGRRQTGVEQLAGAGHHAVARRAVLDPQLNHLQLVERERRQAAQRHGPQRRLPLAGQRAGGDVQPQQAVFLLCRRDAAQVRARRDALHRGVDQIVVRHPGGEVQAARRASRRGTSTLVQPCRSKMALWISANVPSKRCSHGGLARAPPSPPRRLPPRTRGRSARTPARVMQRLPRFAPSPGQPSTPP